MKKTTFVLVTLLVIALTAGLVLTGCPTESKSDSGPSTQNVEFLGATVKVTGEQI